MKANRKKISLIRFFPYLFQYKIEGFSSLFLGLLSGSASVIMTFLLGQGIDTLVGKQQVNFSALFHLLTLFSGIVLVNVLSQYLITRLANRVAYLSANDLRQQAFAHLNRLPLRYYDQQSHGAIVSRFTNDMDNIAIAVTMVLQQVFSGLTIIFLAFFMMIRMSLSLTLVVLAITPVIFLVSFFIARYAQHHFSRQQVLIGDLSGFIHEMVRNQKLVKAYQQEQPNQAQFDAKNQELYLRGQKAQFSSSLSNPASRFVDHLAYVAIGFVGAYFIFRNSPGITIGTISSFTIYATQFSKPFIELSGMTTQLQTALTGLDRAFQLLDETPELPVDNPKTLGQITGEVAFNNVSFSYQKDQPLIEHFHFVAKPGETIAIVGRTGAGKSTLINLLMRFYDVTAGSITIDGIDIRQLDRDDLRRHFGMVLQETWLFDGTLRENLTYGRPDASDDEIWDALEKTEMAAYVQSLAQQLDTPIESQGMKLSDGQRQLLTIARTMISQPAMLILDEATSSVDVLTERLIQDAFLAMMKGKTSFVIAHRLATIQAADQILVMDHGQIIEQGTHEALLAKNGYYAKLHQAQFSPS